MAKRIPGQPGRFITWFRGFLYGRPLEMWPWARTADVVSTRSPPPPDLPDGPAHKLADNYYVSRDHRRSVAPPTVVSSHQLLKEGNSEQLTSGDVTFPQMTTPPTPGPVHDPEWREIPLN